MRRLGFLLCLAFPGAAGALRADGPVITEFMAVNDKRVADEDRDYPDWIEIYNPTALPVNLGGWALTDDPQELQRWKFPEITLEPGRFLLVFSSGKDRTDPQEPLHTSFDLFRLGFLALVDPAGAAASKFDPAYPIQVSDISFGTAMDTTSTVLFKSGAPVSFHVPKDGALGLTWTAAAFDDQAWTGGVSPLGYDTRTQPVYDTLIQTDLDQDLRNVGTSIYVRVPFTVEGPISSNTLFLRVRYDDGFVAYLNGVEVARRNAPATLAWNSRAPAARPAGTDVLSYETINITSRLDLLVQGKNVVAIHGLNESRTGLSFFLDVELEAIEVRGIKPGVHEYFATPTPGAGNLIGWPGVAEPPLFSRPAGAYAESITLELSAAPGAAIRYTLDRSMPSATSRLYTGPIPIDNTTVVRARTFQDGLLPSPVFTQTYVALDATAKTINSNLPLVVLNTFGKGVGDSLWTQAHATIIEVTEGRATLTDAPDYIGNAAIKIRGSSSQQFPKKSWSFEIRDDIDDDLDVSLLGMPAESDWILYAPYTDKTLLRDKLSYDWSNNIGRWAPHGRLVEVYYNTAATGKVRSGDYQGVYVLLEKIKDGDRRVDINDLYYSQNSEPEISGGYLLKKDRLDPGDSGFATSRQNLAFVDPKEQEITQQQRTWIIGYLNKFETALYGANFRNPDTGYARYIDIDSFIDHHILVELTKNIDGYRLSTFMYKDREGKLNMGPIFDYNLTLGNANYLDGWKPDGWYYNLINDNDYPWYRRIFQDPGFVQRYIARWAEFRKDPLSVDRLIQSIEDDVELLKEAEPRDHKKWPILGVYVWPNQFIGKTYAEEIKFMKDWLLGRIEWMDGQFVTAPTLSHAGGQVTPGFQLTITAPAGTILYTVDNTDPRLIDGTRSPSALDYAGPITIQENTRVRARVLRESIWSARKEATYVVATPPLVITEIMYRPLPPPAGSVYTIDDFEFVELKNIGGGAFDLRGVRFTAGVTFDFTQGRVARLEPGEHVLVVNNAAAFASRYGTEGIKVAGEYVGNLLDRGESLTLVGTLDEQLHKFSYLNVWYPETDGAGRSLVIADERAARDRWATKEGWRPSTDDNGSPGKDDPPPASPGGLQLAGDLNQDGRLTISDAVGLLGHLFLAWSTPLPCEGATVAEGGNQALLDLDADGELKVTDAINLLSYLFLRGPAPALGEECTRIKGCPEACRG